MKITTIKSLHDIVTELNFPLFYIDEDDEWIFIVFINPDRNGTLNEHTMKGFSISKQIVMYIEDNLITDIKGNYLTDELLTYIRSDKINSIL